MKRLKRKLKKFYKKNLEYCFGICALGVVLGSALGKPSFSFFRDMGELVAPFDPEVSVIVKARAYTSSESRRFLKHNLLAKGVQPVEIAIENHTGNQYSLSPSSLDINHMPADEAVSRLYRSTIPRQVALRVIGLFFWPVSIPGTIDGLYLHISQKKLRANYLAKSLKKEGEIIPEYATMYRVIFVSKKEMTQDIEFNLIDLETFSQRDLKAKIEAWEEES